MKLEKVFLVAFERGQATLDHDSNQSKFTLTFQVERREDFNGLTEKILRLLHSPTKRLDVTIEENPMNISDGEFKMMTDPKGGFK